MSCRYLLQKGCDTNLQNIEIYLTAFLLSFLRSFCLIIMDDAYCWVYLLYNGYDYSDPAKERRWVHPINQVRDGEGALTLLMEIFQT